MSKRMVWIRSTRSENENSWKYLKIVFLRDQRVNVQWDHKFLQNLSLQHVIDRVNMQGENVIQIVQIVIMFRHKILQLSSVHDATILIPEDNWLR